MFLPLLPFLHDLLYFFATLGQKFKAISDISFWWLILFLWIIHLTVFISNWPKKESTSDYLNHFWIKCKVKFISNFITIKSLFFTFLSFLHKEKNSFIFHRKLVIFFEMSKSYKRRYKNCHWSHRNDYDKNRSFPWRRKFFTSDCTLQLSHILLPLKS